MRRVLAAGVVVAAVLWTIPATAQTAPAAKVPAGPLLNSWYIGVNTGAAVVEKFGGVVGVEGGWRVWRNLDIIGEIVGVKNSVSNAELQRIALLAQSISPTVGGPGFGTMKVPTLYSGIGGRWVIENSGKFRPYFLVAVGGAKRDLQPTLLVNGVDITANPAPYGVTLGQDVIGKYKDVATEGGVGVVAGFGAWYIDGGARLISISGDQRINIARIVIGGGYRF